MSSAKARNYVLTPQILKQYRDAALENAQELLTEATLLFEHKHHARAYFLAVACIEEIGKAVQALDGMGRNLKAAAVAKRLKLQFEDHSQKITAAFYPWVVATPSLHDAVMTFANLMLNLKHGREPSMYTDIKIDGPKVTTPKVVVRAKAAEDCIRLAHAVLSHARPFVTHSPPVIKTAVQDEFFALKPSVFKQMSKTSDFWWYYISRMETGDMALEHAATEYHRKYYLKGVRYKPEVVPE